MSIRSGLFKLLGLCLLAGVLVAGILFPVTGAAGVVANQASDTVDSMSTDLAEEPPPLITTLTDRDGKPIATLYDQYRIPTAPDEISEAMKWAMISVEDRRFYDHHGVDWKGTLRAAITNTSGGDTQGASTLTQQYVKNYLINVTHRGDTLGQQKAQEVSIARKLKEAQIAIQLETKMTKEEILTGYLNVVEFSRQIYGVGAAARAYFNTEASKLTVPQAALLAGMVNNPAVLDPWNNPEGAKKRRNFVLDKMVENRKLDPEDAERIKEEPLGVLPGGPNKPASTCISAKPAYGFFCQYVEDYLIDLGMDKDDLYTGGYTIRTTMDSKATEVAKDAVEKEVSKTEPNVANTLSLVKPGKDRHEVVALVANKDYGTDKEAGQASQGLPYDVFNVTGAGSSYKIFTAAATLEQRKYGIFDTVPVPNFHVSPVFNWGGEHCPTRPSGIRTYCVKNASDGGDTSMSLQDALAKSPNTTFVILEEEVGMKAVVEMASKLGLRKTMASRPADGNVPDPDHERPEYSMNQIEFYGPNELAPQGRGMFTLGASPVSGLEMANVAATIMSGGVWCPPTPILEVINRGGKEFPVKDKPCEQVVPEGLANTLAVGLSKDTAPGGTAYNAASSAGWDRPMIGKTGTTQFQGSATFVGATPQLAGAAMIFRPDLPHGGLVDGGPGNVHATSYGNSNMFGGKTPARTWFRAMKPIMEGLPKKPLPEPDPHYAKVR
ncbi:transglycosylase domain-containing protein [Saccharomonospora viridis]|uniref:transglycosylase domain-containing protein n=1 Tax=Saccharomonospora viridis TaxID=1852 RepID=UPI00056AA6F1|nr:transglycosylase domain-containing protein [Saccharomonospora viridis]SFP63043.1 Membrane carboxypeptidase (penicillin-binding protein) [Saccharomonospora viridis]